MDTLGSLAFLSRKLKKFSIFNFQFSKRGFTLIEMAIAITMLVVLLGIMLGYSQGSRKGIELANNESKLLGLIFNAKALSQSFILEPLDSTKQVCAYGVHVDRNARLAFIFQDMVDADTEDCEIGTSIPSLNVNIFNSGEALPGAINAFYISDLLEFAPSDPDMPNLNDVVFIPPDPTVIINNDPTDSSNSSVGTKSASIIIAAKEDPDTKFRIVVNHAGQISVE